MPYRHGRCAILDLCERRDADPCSFRLKFRRDIPAQARQTDVFAKGTQEFFRLDIILHTLHTLACNS